MSEDADGAVKSIGDIALSLISGVGTSMLGGVVLCDIWKWFVMPVFHTPALTLPQAIGLNIITSWVNVTLSISTGKILVAQDGKQKPFTNAVVTALVYLIVWGWAAVWNSLYIHG